MSKSFQKAQDDYRRAIYDSQQQQIADLKAEVERLKGLVTTIFEITTATKCVSAYPSPQYRVCTEIEDAIEAHYKAQEGGK